MYSINFKRLYIWTNNISRIICCTIFEHNIQSLTFFVNNILEVSHNLSNIMYTLRVLFFTV